MPFLITNVYHQWNTCNSYSCAKKSYGHQTTLFVGISGGSNISTVDHDELNIFLLHPLTTSVARLHRVTTYLWTRNRCQQPRTSASTIQALTLQKFDFSSKYISSIEVQCGELTALSTWSKWPPAIYLLVRTILHGAGLLIMIARPNLLCRTSMITPCQLGIQKLHLHWKYPSGSGIYSHTVRHFPAASPSTAKRSTVESTLFTVTSSPGHVNHVTTIMTLASFTEFWNLYCPRTIRFS